MVWQGRRTGNIRQIDNWIRQWPRVEKEKWVYVFVVIKLEDQPSSHFVEIRKRLCLSLRSGDLTGFLLLRNFSHNYTFIWQLILVTFNFIHFLTFQKITCQKMNNLKVFGRLQIAKRSYSPLPVDPLLRFKTISQTQKAPKVLITGSLGQLGRGLNSVYKYMYGSECVVMSDIVRLPANATDVCKYNSRSAGSDSLIVLVSADYNYLDILNQSSIEEIVVNRNIDTIVHFSALLSAVGEQNVPLALQVNCRGVENILQVAA